MIFRDAKPGDAARVGEVHYRVRAEAYPAFLPPERVNWRPLEERQKQWGEFVADGGYGRDRFLVLAEATEGIVGFAGAGPQRHGDPDFSGEVWSIYVLGAYQGQGHGRRLMAEAARRLAATGSNGLIVWTQPENRPARGFYERLGGVFVRTRPSGGHEVVAYGWRDARALWSHGPPTPPPSGRL